MAARKRKATAAVGPSNPALEEPESSTSSTVVDNIAGDTEIVVQDTAQAANAHVAAAAADVAAADTTSAAADVASADRRVTRSSTRAHHNEAPPVTHEVGPRKRGRKPNKGGADVEGGKDAADVEGGARGTVVIEHCKQCNRFKTRAFQVKEGLEKAFSDITVKLNPEKPRRGCFEIRMEGGETFISLKDLKRPFKPMTDLDMDKVTADIIEKIKAT